MIDELALKELYLRDAIPIRLGNLASSVKRLGFLIHSKKPEKAVYRLLQECKLFSAWTAPESTFETKTELEALQSDLEACFNPAQYSAGTRCFHDLGGCPPITEGIRQPELCACISGIFCYFQTNAVCRNPKGESWMSIF
jgi:hypothetical protein